MGSGKTTVGQELARQLSATFIDLDRVIEKREGQSVTQIFAQQGEASFRAAERAAVMELLASPPAHCVLATGGGAFAQPEIADLLEARGAITIFLDAPAEELHRRCVDSLDAGVRPLLKDLPSFKKLYAERLPAYRQAQWHVDTSGKTIADIATEIARRVGDAEREPQRTRS